MKVIILFVNLIFEYSYRYFRIVVIFFFLILEVYYLFLGCSGINVNEGWNCLVGEWRWRFFCVMVLYWKIWEIIGGFRIVSVMILSYILKSVVCGMDIRVVKMDGFLELGVFWKKRISFLDVKCVVGFYF